MQLRSHRLTARALPKTPHTYAVLHSEAGTMGRVGQSRNTKTRASSVTRTFGTAVLMTGNATAMPVKALRHVSVLLIHTYALSAARTAPSSSRVRVTPSRTALVVRPASSSSAFCCRGPVVFQQRRPSPPLRSD